MKVWVVAAALVLVGCERPAAAPEPAAAPVGMATAGSAAAAAPVAASAPAAAPAAQGVLRVADIAGTWTVSAVHVLPARVQALVNDDPAYLGEKLTIDAEQMGWANPNKSAATLGDICQAPTLTLAGETFAAALAARGGEPPADLGEGADANAYAVGCGVGEWGPQPEAAVLARTASGELVMSWYDGAILRLRRG